METLGARAGIEFRLCGWPYLEATVVTPFAFGSLRARLLAGLALGGVRGRADGSN
jgi:hypothetical protein